MLYIVATPIGNLKDITYRAVEVLKSVDVIACEDKRQTIKLLNAYEIKKPLVVYQKFNEKQACLPICERLERGENVALVSDAGMPLISDPGSELVKTLIERGLEYTVLPGATAFACALVGSGFLDYRFNFVGFLPEKNSERKKLLAKYKNCDVPLIFYCAPHDVDDTVSALYAELGNRKAVACRELTKTFEERVAFDLGEGYNGEKRGEFVIIVDGADEEEKAFDCTAVEAVNKLIACGTDKKEAIKAVAKERGLTKNEVYMQYINQTEKD